MAEEEVTSEKKLSFIKLLIKYRGTLSWCLAIAVVVGVWVFRLANRRSLERTTEYVEAENTFAALRGGQLDVDEASSALSRILDTHGELQQKYSGPLAQALLQAGETDLAEETMAGAFERASSELSPYAQFGEVTLLISRGDYQTALGKSRALQEQLLGDLPYLTVMNTLRIALLTGELGEAAAEKAAWKELITLLEDPTVQEISAQVREEIMKTFQSGQVSLLDYARARYSEL